MIPDRVVQLTLDYILHEVPIDERQSTLAAAALVSCSWLSSARACLYAQPFLCVETPRRHAFHTEKLLETLATRPELVGLVRSLVLHAKQSDLSLLDTILSLFPPMNALTALSLFVHRKEADIVAPHLEKLKSLRHLTVASEITSSLTRAILALGNLRWLHLSASISKHKGAPEFVLRHFTADRELRSAIIFKVIEPAIASRTLASLMLAISSKYPAPDLSSLVSLKKLSFVDRMPRADKSDKEDGASLSLRDTEEYDAVRYLLETLESARLLPNLSSITFFAAPRHETKLWTNASYASNAFFEALPTALRQLDLIAAAFTFDLRKLCNFLEAGARNLPDLRLLELHPVLRSRNLVQDDFEQRLQRRGVDIVWQKAHILVPSGGKRAVLYD